MDLFTAYERDLFKSILAQQFGLAFDKHRSHVLDGAVARRMGETGMAAASAYLALLEKDDAELGSLVDAATNNLSRFFRNRNQLEAISRFIIPALADRCGARNPGPERLRVWVAGCATGEEPYTLAMVLADSLPQRIRFHITATDISRGVLRTARSGEYSRSQTRVIPGPARSRHFVDSDRGLRVNESLRNTVTFEWHNLMTAPPVSEADLILCRNVLTYLTPDARKIAAVRLREAIRVGGFLIIGNSETLPRRCGFKSVQTTWARVYQRPCPLQE